MTGGLWAVLGATLMLGMILAVYLKREGERSWQRHQAAQRMGPLAKDLVRLQILIRDHFTPRMAEMAKAAAKASREFERLGAAWKDES